MSIKSKVLVFKKYSLIRNHKRIIVIQINFRKILSRTGKMIIDFWMPNKEWEGCDVNNPSTRIIKLQ